MRRKAELWNGRGLLPRRNGEDVCQPIRDAILETGMTNRQIAAACGVTQTQVSEAIHRTDEIRFLRSRGFAISFALMLRRSALTVGRFAATGLPRGLTEVSARGFAILRTGRRLMLTRGLPLSAVC